MTNTRIDTADLLKFLDEDKANEARLISETPMSESTLRMIKNGYQPGDLMAKAIRRTIAEIRSRKAAG